MGCKRPKRALDISILFAYLSQAVDGGKGQAWGGDSSLYLLVMQSKEYREEVVVVVVVFGGFSRKILSLEA